MPIEGKETAKSMDHEAGEGSHDSATAKGSKGLKGVSKSRYNPATHSMRKPAGSSGFANKTSTVRPLTSQEHRQAAGALHQAGQTQAAAHHISAAEAMESEAPQAGAGGASMQSGMYGNKVAGSRPQPMGAGGPPQRIGGAPKPAGIGPVGR